MSNVLHVNPEDNVVNALEPLSPGQTVRIDDTRVTVRSPIPVGHKMAIVKIPRGHPIIKYGQTIGLATRDIESGEHVHVHNVKDPVANWKAQHPLPQEAS